MIHDMYIFGCVTANVHLCLQLCCWSVLYLPVQVPSMCIWNRNVSIEIQSDIELPIITVKMRDCVCSGSPVNSTNKSHYIFLACTTSV
jgi:hypothetical protein